MLPYSTRRRRSIFGTAVVLVSVGLLALVCFLSVWLNVLEIRWSLHEHQSNEKHSVVTLQRRRDYHNASVNVTKIANSKTRKCYLNDSNVIRYGPGEMGQAVHLDKGEEEEKGKAAMKKWFMNLVASDQILLDRTIRDVRSASCQKVMYDQDLPSATVVIIFHNEPWSPLIRTVHSVMNRSPPDLLKEVLMLDDSSDRGMTGYG